MATNIRFIRIGGTNNGKTMTATELAHILGLPGPKPSPAVNACVAAASVPVIPFEGRTVKKEKPPFPGYNREFIKRNIYNMVVLRKRTGITTTCKDVHRLVKEICVEEPELARLCGYVGDSSDFVDSCITDLFREGSFSRCAHCWDCHKMRASGRT